MTIVKRSRTLRPSTREQSSSYKIDTENLGNEDILLVEINHESLAFYQTFWFESNQLMGKKSIHFNAKQNGNEIKINWQNITPRLIPQPVVIELKPEWFEMGYYVYVVVMRNEKETYFYVGMTGDRKHKTARSPFYRMSGHFDLLEKSTQNQIIKALKAYWPNNDIQSLLNKMNFTYYAYKMVDFDENMISQHEQKRRFAEKVESGLIELLKAKYGPHNIANHSISAKNYSDVLNVSEAILKDLIIRID